MTIHELLSEIKRVRERLDTRELYTVSLIVVVGLGSFGLGRLSKLEESRVPIRIEQTSAAAIAPPPFQGGAREVVVSSSSKKSPLSSDARVVSSPVKDKGLTTKDFATAPAAGGQLVASKTGTKYHFPWCSGAQRISEANKVWFNSVEEARKAGYTPASNCKGLK